MTLGSFIEESNSNLSLLYDDRESKNILDIVVEETLGLKKQATRSSYNSLLSADEFNKMNSIVKRLLNGEPLQYILGVADFYGLRFKVNRHVLIPRPETEELVDMMIKDSKPMNIPGPAVLDVGTGSGCIAVTVKKHIPQAEVSAVDLSREALQVAKENAAHNRVEINFLQKDFLSEENWPMLGKQDVIVSNPPYVTRPEYHRLHERVRNFEPKMALLAEADFPLIFYRKLCAFGLMYLNEGGIMYVELNSNHSMKIVDMFAKERYAFIKLTRDLQGRDRMLKVRK